MNIFTQFSTRISALTFSAALLLAGCSNPASNDDDDHDDHSELYGVEFIVNGETMVTYFDDNTEGQFEIPEGQGTTLITAEFLDEDGNEIHAEDLADEYFFDWEVDDTEIADIGQSVEDGRWSFRLIGKAAGETTIQFLLMHGNHDAFRTPPVDKSNAISIKVQESNQ